MAWSIPNCDNACADSNAEKCVTAAVSADVVIIATFHLRDLHSGPLVSLVLYRPHT